MIARGSTTSPLRLFEVSRPRRPLDLTSAASAHWCRGWFPKAGSGSFSPRPLEALQRHAFAVGVVHPPRYMPTDRGSGSRILCGAAAPAF